MVNKINFLKNKIYLNDLNKVIRHLESVDGKTFLVTGASGLIGSCIVDAFIHYNRVTKKKVHVIATGRNKERLRERFFYIKESDCINLMEHDVIEKWQCSKIDFIIHAASNADPGSYGLYPVETINTNVLGTNNILSLAMKNKGCKVIFLSTIETYGQSLDNHWFVEGDYSSIDHNLLRSGYPESKRVAELLCRSYHEEYGVDVRIARLGYIYGPTKTQSDNKVVAQFIDKAVEQSDIILKSEGKQKRSYCYVSDTVEAIIIALLKGKACEAYNIAFEGSNISIYEMAQYAAKMAQTKVVLNIENQTNKGVTHSIIDSMKMMSIGWEPSTNFEIGFKKTVDILKSSHEVIKNEE